jgi:hypothetical protein
MALQVEGSSSTLVNLMLEKMSKFGMNYKITKQLKEGHLPVTDIESVEKTIAELEAQVVDNPDMPDMEFLMDLYAKVINFMFN